MPIDIIDTGNNEIHILNNGTTVADIFYALEFLEKERARHRLKNSKRIRPPTGKPRGRPRKNTPVPEIPPT